MKSLIKKQKKLLKKDPGLKMPLKKLKKILKYIFANEKNSAILLALILLTILFDDERQFGNNLIIIMILTFLEGLTSAIVIGYGMEVTHDVIHDGVELPFIKIKKAIKLGIEFVIVNQVYLLIQIFILAFLSGFFSFPDFELEESFLHIGEIIGYFYSHNPIDTILFLILSIAITYIFTFFMEIGIAKLAEGERLRDAFDIKEIKHYIDSIGWKNYIPEYTIIIFTMGILIYLRFGFKLLHVFDFVFDIIFTFLLFMLQFIAIGWVYKEGNYKEKYNDQVESKEIEAKSDN